MKKIIITIALFLPITMYAQATTSPQIVSSPMVDGTTTYVTQSLSDTTWSPSPGVTITEDACHPLVITWDTQYNCQNYINEGGPGTVITSPGPETDQDQSIETPLVMASSDQFSTTSEIVDVSASMSQLQELQYLVSVLQNLIKEFNQLKTN